MTEVQISPVAWSIFDKQYYKDESTTQWEYVEYKERNVSVSGLTEYNIINQDLDVPLLMADSFLQVKCKIVRNDNPLDCDVNLPMVNTDWMVHRFRNPIEIMGPPMMLEAGLKSWASSVNSAGFDR